MATQIIQLPNVKKMSSRVIRVLGGNHGEFTLQGTNTYIIGTGNDRLLLDTGAGKDTWIKNLKETLQKEQATVSQVIITHWHHDHVGGIWNLLEYAPGTVIHKHLPKDGQVKIRDGQRFEVEGASLKAVFFPGHTSDHMAFILEEEDSMFTGDNVLGHGTSLYEDLPVYLSSLNSMRTLFMGRVYPVHGPVIEDGPQIVLKYIEHRKHRENQVIQVLSSVETQDPQDEFACTLVEIVNVLYRDISEKLHLTTQNGVLQILRKLQAEDLVVEFSNSKWKSKNLAAF